MYIFNFNRQAYVLISLGSIFQRAQITAVTPGGPGELPPEAPTDPYVTLSRHTAPVIPTQLPQVMPMAPIVDGSALFSELLALLPANWLMLWLRLDNAAPSLQSYYSSFITTTGCSAPAMGIGIRPRSCGHLWLSLSTPWQVPTFRIEACDELMPPEHRLPRGP
jgi:hypothetical protein